jgi:DNA-directed RNA polymerase specialized sigma24 family protein
VSEKVDYIERVVRDGRAAPIAQRDSFNAYTWFIVRRGCSKALRDRKRRGIPTVRLAVDPVARDRGIDALMRRDMLHVMLTSALSEFEQRAVTLFYLDGHEHSCCALRMNMSVGAYRRLLYASMTKLRDAHGWRSDH